MDFVDSARVGTLVSESEKKVFDLFETMVRSTGQERTKSAVALANLLGNLGNSASTSTARKTSDLSVSSISCAYSEKI